MRNTLFATMSFLLIVIALAASLYSYSQAHSYITDNLKGNSAWYILAGIAIIVELVALAVMVEVGRLKHWSSFLAVPLMLALLVGSIGVNLYLEGGKAGLILSDAKATRGIDIIMANGHKETLEKLLKQQKRILSSRRVDKTKLDKINKKIEAQAKWAKGTAVAGRSPVDEMITKITGVSESTLALTIIMLFIFVPIMVRVLFMHFGIMFMREIKLEAKALPVQEKEEEPTPVKKSELPKTGSLRLVKSDREGRLGSMFDRDPEDDVVRLPRKKRKRKPQSAYLEEQELVKEFVASMTEQFRPHEGWEEFQKQYPDALPQRSYHRAMTALANNGYIGTKKVSGKKFFVPKDLGDLFRQTA